MSGRIANELRGIPLYWLVIIFSLLGFAAIGFLFIVIEAIAWIT